jgi:hypothetical protein
MQPLASKRPLFIALALLLSGCASTAPMHTPVEGIEIQGFASDGVTPDPAKRLVLNRKDIEAMVAESWPTDNYPVLADSRLSSADRKTAFVQMTLTGRYVLKCEPPFKMVKIENEASSNDRLIEIWTAQMCGTLKWIVSKADGERIPTVSRLK